MWDVIIALEYQRKYYDELPEKITLAQSCLAEAVVEHAKKLSTKMRISALVIMGFGTLAVLWLSTHVGRLLYRVRWITGADRPSGRFATNASRGVGWRLVLFRRHFFRRNGSKGICSGEFHIE